MSPTSPTTSSGLSDSNNSNSAQKPPFGRRLTAWLLLIGAIAGTGLYKYDQSTRPTILSGPMIQLTGPNSVSVIWTAQSPFDSGVVELTSPDDETPVTETVPSLDSLYRSEFEELKPGLRYRYQVGNEGLLSNHAASAGPFTFRTPPGRDESIRFLAFGDSGIGSNTQALLADRMFACNPDVIIHTGDLIYPAGSPEDYYLNFYFPYRKLLRQTFFLPCLGNHDIATDKGTPLLEEFDLPRNGPEGIEPERNFYFDYGPARFVAMDTNLDAHGGAISHEQMKTSIAAWLRDVLTNCDAKWRFVYFHHPFYTNSSHSAEGAAFVKEAFVNVIEECGVDVVFNGHNHLYERTAPIYQEKIIPEERIGLENLKIDNIETTVRRFNRDAARFDITDDKPSENPVGLEEGNPRGVIYIVTGAGGAQRYKEKNDPPEYIRVYNDAEFSFTDAELTPTTLRIRQIDVNGRAIDRFTITKE